LSYGLLAVNYAPLDRKCSLSKEEKENYKLLIVSLPETFAYHYVILGDQVVPLDYIFLYIKLRLIA